MKPTSSTITKQLTRTLKAAEGKVHHGPAFFVAKMELVDNLRGSILIVGPVKIPDMIQMMKCGLGEGAGTAKLKKESRSDDIEP